jgi:hypothetical protein
VWYVFTHVGSAPSITNDKRDYFKMSLPTFNECSFYNCSFNFGTPAAAGVQPTTVTTVVQQMSNSSCVLPQQHQQQQEQDMQSDDDTAAPLVKTPRACVPMQQQQQKQDMQAADDATTIIKGSNTCVSLQQQKQKQDMQAADDATTIIKGSNTCVSLQQQKQKQDMQAADDATTIIKGSNTCVSLQQQKQKQDMQAVDVTASPVIKTPGLLHSLLSAFFFQWKLFILFLVLQQVVFWTIADHVRFQEPYGPEPAPEGWEAMMRLQERSRSSTVQLGIPPAVQGIVYVGIVSNVLLRATEIYLINY